MYDCFEHLKVWVNRMRVNDAYKTGGSGKGVVRGTVGQVASFCLNLMSSLPL